MQTEKEPAAHRGGIRSFIAVLSAAAMLLFALCGAPGQKFTPEKEPFAVRVASVLGEDEAEAANESRTVRLGGDVFGIRMFSDGVIVASLSEIYTENRTVCPAKEAGIEAGDYILAANGTPVTGNAQLAAVLARGEPTELLVRSGEEMRTVTLTPVLCGASYKAGMWIRDSAAGIGTVTFFTDDGSVFAGLGHGICDVDTREVLAMRSGEPAAISICGIARGVPGTPGRLRGFFAGEESLGKLVLNEETGIYGTVTCPAPGQTVEVLEPKDVHTGPVQIVATVDRNGPRFFDAEIERVRENGGETKTLVVRVTDEELLNKTGGIVQGMSGCPILQDGKLAGAVTHVFVEDPTRGYGIFADTMLRRAESIRNTAAG